MHRFDIVDLTVGCKKIEVADLPDDIKTKFAERKNLVETKIQKILKLVNQDAVDQYEFSYSMYAHTNEGVETVYPEWEFVCVKIGNWETFIDITEDLATEMVAKILTVL